MRLRRPGPGLPAHPRPAAAHAQSEAALKEYFEGRTVKLKLAMPGTEDGVDVYPGTSKPLDFPRHAGRLKNYGTALRAGRRGAGHQGQGQVQADRVPARRRRLRHHGRRDLLERQRGSAPKTKREQNLEARAQAGAGSRPAARDQGRARRPQGRRASARTPGTAPRSPRPRRPKKANIRQRRLEGGSRFNIRYNDGVPASALTPEAIKEALAAYVEFDEPAPAPAEVASALPVAGSVPVGKPGPGGLPGQKEGLDEYLHMIEGSRRLPGSHRHMAKTWDLFPSAGRSAGLGVLAREGLVLSSPKPNGEFLVHRRMVKAQHVSTGCVNVVEALKPGAWALEHVGAVCDGAAAESATWARWWWALEPR